MPPEVLELSAKFMRDPLRILVKKEALTLEGIKQFYVAIEEEFKLEDDPRITKLGRFLRKSSLDELPQLWNVIRGDMSLVGPRPITEDELAMYGHHAATLLSYRPGLSGSWQTNGRGQTIYPERMWAELEYCRSASLSGDVLVLLKTLAMPFRYNGV